MLHYDDGPISISIDDRKGGQRTGQELPGLARWAAKGTYGVGFSRVIGFPAFRFQNASCNGNTPPCGGDPRLFALGIPPHIVKPSVRERCQDRVNDRYGDAFAGDPHRTEDAGRHSGTLGRHHADREPIHQSPRHGRTKSGHEHRIDEPSDRRARGHSANHRRSPVATARAKERP